MPVVSVSTTWGSAAPGEAQASEVLSPLVNPHSFRALLAKGEIHT